jgi:hypothetical protein
MHSRFDTTTDIRIIKVFKNDCFHRYEVGSHTHLQKRWITNIRSKNMKNAKPIFDYAIKQSDVMVVERILVRVLPALVAHGQTLTAESIREAQEIAVPDVLYAHMLQVAEELVGGPFPPLEGAAYV